MLMSRKGEMVTGRSRHSMQCRRERRGSGNRNLLQVRVERGEIQNGKRCVVDKLWRDGSDQRISAC